MRPIVASTRHKLSIIATTRISSSIYRPKRPMTASTTYPQSLVINYDYKTGKVTEQASTMNAKEFMLSGGQGVYTAMRTVCGGSRIFLLDDHLQRISNSHRMVLADSEQQKDPEHWRNLLVPIIRRGLESFKSTTENDDRKITILVGADHVSLQLTELKAPLNGVCWVKFVQGKRHNPMAKDLQWVHDREKLEKQIISPINEIVLIESGPETRVYEGLSSNFFATRRVSEDKQPGYANFELLSAPLDSVLLGTIMKLVLRICERDCIKVVYDSRVDFSRWSGAFVSSTSRLVLPVSKIITDCGEHLMDSRDPLVVHLLESVKGLAREQSTEI